MGDLLFRNDLTQGRIRSLNRHLGCADFDRLGNRGWIEGEIDLALLIDLQSKVPLFGRLESLRVHSNRVGRDGQQRHRIVARGIGLRVTGDTRGLRRDLDRRTGDDGSRFVGHGAGETSVGLAIKKLADRKQNDGKQRASFQHLIPHTMSLSTGERIASPLRK